MKSLIPFKFLIFCGFTIIFGARSVWARPSIESEGVGAGGGGKAIYCPHENTYQVLDYQRASSDFDLTPIKDIHGESALEKAIAIVRRIEKFNPKRVNQYIQDLTEFSNNQTLVAEGEMVITRDTHEIAYCADGVIEQVITQIIPSTPYQKRYKVHRDRFRKLSLFQQAIMMVHEVILKETKSLGYHDADQAVTLNTFLISEQLNQATQEDFARVLNGAGLFYLGQQVDGTDYPVTSESLLQFGNALTRDPWTTRHPHYRSRALTIAALSSDLWILDCNAKNAQMNLPLSGIEIFYRYGNRDNQRNRCKEAQRVFDSIKDESERIFVKIRWNIYYAIDSVSVFTQQ